MSMPDDELLQIVIWAGLETVAGGCPVPESLNMATCAARRRRRSGSC